MTKFTCPYCDSAFLQFIETEEMLREHIMKVHGRVLSFSGRSIGRVSERSEEDKGK